MKKLLFSILILTTVLFSALFVAAENAPITHTYLSAINGSEYVFETVITPPATMMYKPIVAMYDSRNALCGLSIENNFLGSKNVKKSFTIKVTPWGTPKTVKLMLWNSTGKPVPLSQYELVPTKVCNQDFGTIANVQFTKIQSKNYVFETVLNSPADATYTPVIRMYDASGNICGFKEFESISLKANQPVLKEFEVYSSSTPARICFTLRDGENVAQFTNISTNVSIEKHGTIMVADPTTGVKLFATDGTYIEYDFAENFTLSYGNTLVKNKQIAYDYLKELKLKSYKREADLYTGGRPLPDDWTAYYDWLILFEEDRYSKATPASDALYFYNLDANRYTPTGYLNNYSNRMVRVLISPDGKITSMAFPGDNLFAKLNAGKSYSETFYDSQTKTFNNELIVKDNAKILYLPTKKGTSESEFKALSPSDISNGTYYIKEYTTTSNEQIILVTHIVSEQEIASENKEPIDKINKVLNGNGTKSLKNTKLSISSGDIPEINDRANELAETFRTNIVKCLDDALNNAHQHILSSSYIKTKYAVEISAAKQAYNELQALDTTYNTEYMNALENAIIDVVVDGRKTLEWLFSYFF